MKKLSSAQSLILWSSFVILSGMAFLFIAIYSDTDAEKILRSSVLDGYKDQLKELQVTDINSKTYRWTFRNTLEDDDAPEFFTVCRGKVGFEYQGMKFSEDFEYNCIGFPGTVKLATYPWSSLYSHNHFDVDVVFSNYDRDHDDSAISVSDLASIKEDLKKSIEAAIKKVPEAILELKEI